MRKHSKKLEAAKKTLEDLQVKTVGLEEKRKEACAGLTRAQNGVVATRLATRADQALTVLAVLFLVVSLPWGEVQPSQLSRGNGEPKVRILSASISTWGPHAEGFLRSAGVGRFQTAPLAGANSMSEVHKLWKQSGFLGTAGTARQSENSTKGTSSGTNIASDVRGRSGFDWSAQLARLRLNGVARHGVHDEWAG